ncbi:RNA helicase aquarius [Labeo rohita]|uniref:RNA helicase aquarius n=2 Tax=Labeonini TaxID=2743697 RepID=A0ABQ8LVS9_LABRO|nr:RNA helicase aquarius [Labeo rohita]
MQKDSRVIKTSAPPVSQINAEYVTQLSNKYWAPHVKNKLPFDSQVIEDIYQNEILKSKFSIRKIMLLEFSQYLESYLWLNYTPEVSTNSYLMSICCIVNEKFRENVPAWEVFKKAPTHFPHFFKCVMESCLSGEQLGLSLKEQTVLLLFLDHCFNSLEVDLIREQVQKLVSLPMWMCLLPMRLQQELKKVPKLQKFWNLIKKNYEKMDSQEMEQAKKERTFLASLIKKFQAVLMSIPAAGKPVCSHQHFCVRYHLFFRAADARPRALLAAPLTRADVPSSHHPPVRAGDGSVSMEKVHYCERFIEFMIDLELSHLTDREKEGHLFCQLLDMLKFYTGFEISDQTGNALTQKEMTTLHYDRITSLQRAAFAHFPELNDFALSNVAAVDTRDSLTKHFGHLSPNTLHRVSAYLCLLPELPDGEDTSYDKEFLLELLVSRHERRISQIEQLNQMPLYPTEKIIWDENIVPTEYYSGEGCLALPKLNLQFLTLHDYLLRNFNLFRLESTYEIRQDIEDVTIVSFSIVEVAKPNIGENWPARVRADVTINLNVRDNIRNEWEGLRKHDVCFLITVRPNLLYGTRFDRRQPFVDQAGLVYVRGCEVQGMLDDKGRVIEEVWLDPNQYQQDMTNSIQNGAEDPYETFNIIMRRKPKENNFKAVLETIRNLMNTECVVPDWLHDIILGYGDPGSAHYSKMPNQISSLDFNDTFLSIEHLKSCFPNHAVKVTEEDPTRQVPPFRIRFPVQNAKGKKRKANEEEKQDEEDLTLVVEPHVIPNRGPYPYNQPKRNTIQFTPTQIEAIRAGMQPGLTMVVGPPGTGKTDVAVQIISNLYHNFPEQRTLIVTHSNQALNQLFEKIMALDIDERHLLRLGHGEEELETEKDFSRYGRVNYVLSRRLELLREVARLQESLDVPGDVSYTCETAGHFYLYQVMSRWEEYMSKVKPKPAREVKTEDVASHFPFHKYFSNAPQPVFKGQSYQEDMDIAEGCYRHIRKIFTQLETCSCNKVVRQSRSAAAVHVFVGLCFWSVCSGNAVSQASLLKIQVDAVLKISSWVNLSSLHRLNRNGYSILACATHAERKPEMLFLTNDRNSEVFMNASSLLQEFRAFELLRSGLDRSKYLLVKEAKIIAMTCTHAALKRHDLVELGFKYDNILMEEAAQILEIETFIPLLLQLPPVIKNMAFQKYSNMEQSLFTRFVRLGVPTVDLDAQGRARASLCNLYNWRYKQLGNLPHVQLQPEFQAPNPGFTYDFQLINVEDFNGNLAEAEYAVALYMYMRLLGYPSERISILTTYNGQKHLIRDVINQRCATNSFFGQPNKLQKRVFNPQTRDADVCSCGWASELQCGTLLDLINRSLFSLFCSSGQRAESTCPRSSRLADEFYIGHHLLRGRDPATETKEEQNDNETPAGFNTRPQEMKYEAVAAFCCLLLCHEQVTTVDRFQGQQNDYIILSLVRTKAVGHLRDVRRLVVAMSRARLGLYIFARVSLFQNCYELTPAFSQLTARPLQLHIRPHEYYSSTEERSSEPDQVIKDMPEMANRVYNMYMHMIQSMQQHRQQHLLDPPRQVLNSEEPMEAEEEHPETQNQSEEKQPTAAEEEEGQTKMEDQNDEEEQEQDHTKMPEHPGRDSDSGDSDEDGGA